MHVRTHTADIVIAVCHDVKVKVTSHNFMDTKLWSKVQGAGRASSGTARMDWVCNGTSSRVSRLMLGLFSILPVLVMLSVTGGARYAVTVLLVKCTIVHIVTGLTGDWKSRTYREKRDERRQDLGRIRTKHLFRVISGVSNRATNNATSL